MNKGLMSKFKEALFSVLPVTVIVLALSFTPLIDVTVGEAATFGVSALLLIVGISSWPVCLVWSHPSAALSHTVS